MIPDVFQLKLEAEYVQAGEGDAAEIADARADLFGNGLRERLHQLGDLPLLAQEARLSDPDLLLGRERADLRRELAGQPIEIGDQTGRDRRGGSAVRFAGHGALVTSVDV